MNADNPIRFAVVGYGHIGRRHGELIHAHPEAELIAVCEPDPAAVTDLPAGVRPYADLETLLRAEPTVEVCSICTPNGFHAAQALQVLSDRRHVVIEKPMALQRVACEAVIHRALNVGRQVFCVMQNRYSPAVAWLRQLVTEGTLGPIASVQVNCFWNRDERYYFMPDGRPHPWHGDALLDGGVLFTQFAHFIDILYWLFGDIDQIHTRLAKARPWMPFPDSGVVSFRLQAGGLGGLHFSTAAYGRNFESTITVLGQRGVVQIGGQYMSELKYCQIEGVSAPDLPAASLPNTYRAGYEGSAANHHHVIQNVVDVLRGRCEVTTNALEGMKVVEIIERIYRAGQLGTEEGLIEKIL